MPPPRETPPVEPRATVIPASDAFISPAYLRLQADLEESGRVFLIGFSAPWALETLSQLQARGVAVPPGAVTLDAVGFWKTARGRTNPDRFIRYLSETWHCRCVDALEQYLAEIFRSIFKQRPECLKGESTITVADVMRHASIQEVLAFVAEEKVRKPMRDGFLGLSKELVRMGVSVPDDAGVPTVAEAIEVRHLIVHTGGVVDRAFLLKSRRTDLKEGEVFPLDEDYGSHASSSVDDWARRLDEQVIAHFKLTFSTAEYRRR